jgi:3-mercaptopyruvate sulfurtransferase SseA
MKQSENQSPALQPRPLILIAIGLILLIGAAVWMVLNPGQPQANAPRPTLTNDPNGPFPQISRVMLEDAKKAFDEKSAVFVDVRSPESYNAAHVTGAINIPLAELESRAGELNPADWIITYCT